MAAIPNKFNRGFRAGVKPRSLLSLQLLHLMLELGMLRFLANPDFYSNCIGVIHYAPKTLKILGRLLLYTIQKSKIIHPLISPLPGERKKSIPADTLFFLFSSP